MWSTTDTNAHTQGKLCARTKTFFLMWRHPLVFHKFWNLFFCAEHAQGIHLKGLLIRRRRNIRKYAGTGKKHSTSGNFVRQNRFCARTHTHTHTHTQTPQSLMWLTTHCGVLCCVCFPLMWRKNKPHQSHKLAISKMRWFCVWSTEMWHTYTTA